jgi:hypothetical protein
MSNAIGPYIAGDAQIDPAMGKCIARNSASRKEFVAKSAFQILDEDASLAARQASG